MVYIMTHGICWFGVLSTVLLDEIVNYETKNLQPVARLEREKKPERGVSFGDVLDRRIEHISF